MVLRKVKAAMRRVLGFFGPAPAPFDAELANTFDTAMRFLHWGDYESAARLFEACAARAPHIDAPYFYLGEACRMAGNTGAAIDAYRQYLARDAHDALGAGIKLYLLGVAPQPEALPDAYVRLLFDQYSNSYEEKLVCDLGYKGPQLVARAVFAAGAPPYGHVLDLGCGTGLSAMPYQGVAESITGVDLSGGMLAKAEEKDIYARLVRQDIAAFLEGAAAQGQPRYGLVLCVDALVYVGALDGFLRLVLPVMAHGGLLAFTVQHSEGAGLVLGPDHRYAHSQTYVEAEMAKAGFDVLHCAREILRTEHGAPVYGLVVVGRKR